MRWRDSQVCQLYRMRCGMQLCSSSKVSWAREKVWPNLTLYESSVDCRPSHKVVASGKQFDNFEGETPLPLPSEAENDSIVSVLIPKEPTGPSFHHEAPMAQSGLQSNTIPVLPSQRRGSVGDRPPIFVDFLLPDQFAKHLDTIKRDLGEATASRRFVPLMPYRISMRLMENAFAEIMAEYKLLDLPSFMALLDAQYAASPVDPADNSARWAIVNAIIALAVRSKTAPGSEHCLSDIPRGYYQNALTVIPDLILRAPSLLSIQALLAMAIFARNISDRQAFVMLASNASRQLELFTSVTIDPEEMVRYERTCGVLHILNQVIGSENRPRTQPPILIGPN
ncbi:hypothetical protein F4818DRAFT_126631 [Hypoxylon cercidicola]|nr:hypothetical protein F4818DRAFT_126631 [Hypoxylon cercidicola]